MSGNKYEIIMSLEEFVFIEKEPLEILAGALLKDTETLDYLLQLKIRNNCDYTVQSAKFEIVLIDNNSEVTGNRVAHWYDDLSVKKGDTFGEKEAVLIPYSKGISDISVKCLDVVFTNQKHWKSGEDIKQIINSEIISQAKSNLSSEHLADWETAVELLDSIQGWESADQLREEAVNKIKRYKEDNYNDCIQRMEKANDEATFNSIAKIFAELKNYRESENYYEQCLKEAQTCREKKNEKKRYLIKRSLLASSIIVALIVCLVVGTLIYKNSKYNDAIKMGKEGKYTQAVKQLKKLGDYKKSKEYVREFMTKKEKDEATESIRDYYSQREELVAKMESEQIEEAFPYWDEDEYVEKTNLSTEEIEDIINLKAVYGYLEDIVLDLDKEKYGVFGLASFDEGTGANEAKNDYEDIIKQMKKSDLSIAKKIVGYFNKYKKKYIGKTFIFKPQSGDGSQIGDERMILLTALGFQKRNKNKELTVDNIEPIVVVGLSQEYDDYNWMQGFGTVKDVENGKRIYDSFSKYEYEGELHEDYEIDKSHYLIFSGDNVTWHYCKKDFTFVAQKWEYSDY